MHHWMVHAKEEFQNILMMDQGIHFTTFDCILRNERYTLIYFMGFQICIFNTKKSKLTFSNGPQLMEKAYGKFSCIIGQYMQKKNIKIFSCWVRGVHSTTFDPKLRNERFTLIFFMGFQICIFNTINGKLTFSNGPQLMEKSLWQIVMHHWTVHAKVEFQNFPILCHRGFIPHLWS